LKQFIASVIDNKEVMSGAYIVWLKAPEIASEAKAGQFVMVRCGEETVVPRPLSVHQINGNKLALLFNVVGKGTYWLSQRKAGDRVGLFGSLGTGFSIYPTSHNILLVAGGMGIAPLYFLAKEASSRGYDVTLLYGTTNNQRYPVSSDIRLISATEDGSVGFRGRVTELLSGYIDWADQVFACGPMSMYHYMNQNSNKLLKEKPVQVSLEVRMGCGRGVCYGCTIKTKGGLKRVCEHGPVFDLDDILWDELDF
jgi:dihydroorotate dehydrogenase electron transfer subunit